MISLKKRASGFTIVELLIVIVVIGILVSLILSTHSQIQAKNRNNERAQDIDAVQAQLTTFLSQKDYYPSLGDLNNAKWRHDNMPHLPAGALIDPSNPKHSTVLVAAPQPKSYAYAVKDGSGNSCEADHTTCVQYTLTATYEGTVSGATTVVKNNLD